MSWRNIVVAVALAVLIALMPLMTVGPVSGLVGGAVAFAVLMWVQSEGVRGCGAAYDAGREAGVSEGIAQVLAGATNIAAVCGECGDVLSIADQDSLGPAIAHHLEFECTAEIEG